MRTREEQIADLANLFGEEGIFSFVDDLDAATKHILEAERRAEKRVRAEIGRDSERLDWISSTLVEMKLLVATSVTGRRRFVKNVTLSGPLPASHFRKAIDAAREVG